MRFHRILPLAAGLACMLAVAGCSRKSPDERLKQAYEFVQQGDMTSAEVEARKIVEKNPDDPAAIQASILLAKIYVSQRSFDEAALELEATLPKVKQTDPVGREVLSTYLSVLQQEKKFKEAYDVAGKYQKEYANDPGTSLSLTTAQIDIETRAGHTSHARQMLIDLVARTTATAEFNLYRQMMVNTYFADKDTTGAVQYLEKELAAQKDPQNAYNIRLQLAQIAALQGDYDHARSYLSDATKEFSTLAKKELDGDQRVMMALSLAAAYEMSGNRAGARRIYQAVYESGLSNPQLVGATVQGMVQDLLSLDQTSASVAFLHDAARKYPSGPFGKVADRIEQAAGAGKLRDIAPVDTSTLTMKFSKDAPLWPADLSKVLGISDLSSTSTARTSASVRIAPPTASRHALGTPGAAVMAATPKTTSPL